MKPKKPGFSLTGIWKETAYNPCRPWPQTNHQDFKANIIICSK